VGRRRSVEKCLEPGCRKRAGDLGLCAECAKDEQKRLRVLSDDYKFMLNAIPDSDNPRLIELKRKFTEALRTTIRVVK